MEAVERILSKYSDHFCSSLVKEIFASEMERARFLNMLSTFLKVKLSKLWSHYDCELSVENFLAIFEIGGVELLQELKNHRIKFNLIPSKASFFKLLHSTSLRSRLFA